MNWHSTLCFRRFREKHTLLSRLYWCSELGRACVRQGTALKEDSSFVVDELNPGFPRSMLSLRVGDVEEQFDENANTERLHLLVMCSANLESYLQDVTLLFVGAQGHEVEPWRLDDVGRALARPIANSSTVPDMLKYAEALFQVSFDDGHMSQWNRAYKLRCAAAHNGGVVTAKVLRDIPDIKLPLGARLVLKWPDLMGYLESAEAMATVVDKAVASKRTRVLEMVWVLREWRECKKLPGRDVLWSKLHDLGFGTFDRTTRLAVEEQVYGASPE